MCYHTEIWSKLSTFLQTFENASSGEKTFVYLFRFHLPLFLREQLTMGHRWFAQWFGTEQTTSHYLNPWHRSVTHRYIIGYYSDVMMSAMASQITSLTIVYSTVFSGADQRKHVVTCNLSGDIIHNGPWDLARVRQFIRLVWQAGISGHYRVKW